MNLVLTLAEAFCKMYMPHCNQRKQLLKDVLGARTLQYHQPSDCSSFHALQSYLFIYSFFFHSEPNFDKIGRKGCSGGEVECFVASSDDTFASTTYPQIA